MTVDTVITGGTVVTTEETFEGAIAIENGAIVAVGDESRLPEADRRVDATGMIVMPGVVDPHVHIDEVPENRAGTYAAETAAAALGGVTTVIDFAWQGGERTSGADERDLVDGIEHKKEQGSRAYVDHSVHGALHYEDGATFEQIEPAIDAGVTSFKMFMSTYEVGVSNGFINEAFAHIADLDAVAVLHTEDPSVCENMLDRLKRDGHGAPEYYPRSRPDYAEAMGAEAALRMAQEAGVKYYGIHTTCRKAAAVIDRFRDDGSRVRAETCIHYTTLDESIHEVLGNLPKIAPPIRTRDDIEAMFEYLDTGTLDVVSTDHAVYHRASKETDTWWESPYGANSLQRSLPVFHDEAINRRDRSYPFLVRVMCTNPAKIFGMPQKGTLAPGTDADIVVFDPDETETITAETNASNSTFSIYEGRTVTGRVKQTFVRGELVADDGEIVTNPGHGEFVEREIPRWEVE